MSALATGEPSSADATLPGLVGVGSGTGPDNWPHTTRPLPWLVAGFLAMIFVVPFDSIVFKVHLPANATFDRVFLIAMMTMFVVSRLRSRREGPRRRLTPIETTVLTFGGVALLSIVLNIDRVFQQNQVSFVEKGFSQLIAYGAFFFVVIATVRPAEMPAFSRLILGLTCLTALGTFYEARTGYNIFYEWSATLLHPIATVAHAPTNIHSAAGSRTVVGPTMHGLALASMLTIGLPFAVLPAIETRRMDVRVWYLLAIGLILAADLATSRKTAMFAPVAAFIVLIAHKRELLRWTPLALIVLIPVIHFAAPGALGGIKQIFPSSTNGDYTDGRAGDYAAIAPDVLNNVIIGRGYATMDVTNRRTYRILDNQYLGMLFEVGVIGLVAYMAIVGTALMTAHRVIRGGGMRAPPALAAAAGCAAFGLVSATYDAGGFPQAVYSFLFVAGLIAIAASKRDEQQSAHRATRHTGIPPSGDWLGRPGPHRSRRTGQPGETFRARSNGPAAK